MQCEPADRVDGDIGQSLLAINSVGSAPPMPIFVMASGSVPLFVKMSVCAALCDPMSWLEKLRLGATFTPGLPVAIAKVVVACWTPVATVTVFAPVVALGSICNCAVAEVGVVTVTGPN